MSVPDAIRVLQIANEPASVTERIVAKSVISARHRLAAKGREVVSAITHIVVVRTGMNDLQQRSVPCGFDLEPGRSK